MQQEHNSSLYSFAETTQNKNTEVLIIDKAEIQTNLDLSEESPREIVVDLRVVKSNQVDDEIIISGLGIDNDVGIEEVLISEPIEVIAENLQGGDDDRIVELVSSPDIEEDLASPNIVELVSSPDIEEDLASPNTETSLIREELETESIEYRETHLVTITELLEKEFGVFIPDLEPERAEEVLEILDNLLEVIQVSLSNLENGSESSLDMESIQDICIELFERLGIEYDEEKLEVFIELMIEQYKAVSDSELDSIESLNRKGTREHIVSNTNAYATNLAGQIYVLPSQLGRISLLHIAA